MASYWPSKDWTMKKQQGIALTFRRLFKDEKKCEIISGQNNFDAWRKERLEPKAISTCFDGVKSSWETGLTFDWDNFDGYTSVVVLSMHFPSVPADLWIAGGNGRRKLTAYSSCWQQLVKDGWLLFLVSSPPPSPSPTITIIIVDAANWALQV